MKRFISRRKVLRRLADAGAVALSLGRIRAADQPVGGDLIQRENALVGTTDWILSSPHVDPTTKYRCPWIEGYCSRTSARPGESITFHVSADPPSLFNLDIYRMGYYGGTGGRWMKRIGPLGGIPQTTPEPRESRLMDCQWPACAEIRIPDDWLSGVYLGKLTRESDGLQSYLIFIVRDDRKADFIFQCSDTTWQAYNRWPSQFSLYDDGLSQWYWGGGVRVGFNRPYGKYCQILDQPLSTGSGEFFLWEYPMAFWLEKEGWDVTYISNLDTHSDADSLLRCRGFLSLGHDEYWSIEMFRSAQRAIQNGVSFGFFSGNAVCGRIEFSKDDRDHSRVFERVGVFGPPGGTREFTAMSSLRQERPYANELIGAHSTGPVTGGADWICSAPDHWIYDGTGMKRGRSDSRVDWLGMAR